MRRPLLYILLLFTLGILVQYAFHIKTLFLGIAFMLSVFMLIFIFQNNMQRIICLLIAIVMLSSLYFQMVEHNHSWINQFHKKEVWIKGYILDTIKKDESYYQAVIQLEAIQYKEITKKCNEKILLNLTGEQGNIYKKIGQSIKIKGKMRLPSSNRNPKTFNYQRYLKTKNIHMIMNAKAKDIQWTEGDTKLILQYIGPFKYDFNNKISQYMNKESAGVLMGLLFGDKQFIDQDIYHDFKLNGTAHILAVSGIHMGILYSILQLFGKHKSLLKDIITIGFILTYAFISNFSPSVTRAGIMIALYILSRYVNKRYDLISAAAFTALLMMLMNPYAIFDVGFQLSFAAVFSVGIIFPYIKNKLKYQHISIDMLTVVLAIQLGTIPLIAYHFNYFSLVAFFINSPVILGASIILPIAFLMLPLSILGGEILLWITLLEEMLIEALIYMNQISTMLPNAFLNVVSPPVCLILLYYGAILALTYEGVWTKIKKHKEKAVLIGIVVIIISCLGIALYADPYDIVFVDVGQGDCIHIKTANGKNILVDGGGNANFDVGEKILAPYLFKNGVNQIDMACITHLHEDHYKGIISLMNITRIKELALPTQDKEHPLIDEIKQLCKEKKTNIIYLGKNDKISIANDISMLVFHPKEQSGNFQEENENNQSLVLLLDYLGTKVLLTGDIEQETEALLVKEISTLSANILKAPHHGSDTSSTMDFIEKVDPEIAIIQVGKNNRFGLPSKEVLKRYQDKEIKIYRNDKNGAIMVNIQKDKVNIKTMLEER